MTVRKTAVKKTISERGPFGLGYPEAINLCELEVFKGLLKKIYERYYAKENYNQVSPLDIIQRAVDAHLAKEDDLQQQLQTLRYGEFNK